MVISIATLFPELYTNFLATSLLARAQEKEIVSIKLSNLFSYAKAGSRVDSPSFGPGAGMLIKPDIIEKAIEDIEEKQGSAYKIFFSPHGTKLNQDLINNIAQAAIKKKHILLIPARYEGIDARVEEYYADLIVSLGDMVLMGGDLPAMVLIEGMLRLIPGVVGKQESVEHDSFNGPFVDYPEYTKPVIWKDKTVPEVIRSGDHEKICTWRKEQAARRTIFHHFGWLRSHVKNRNDKELAHKLIPSHYVVLMHTDVILEEDKIGTSSITSLDIHDIARSATTYGLKGYYIVTPLKDQEKIAEILLGFWKSERGERYNRSRAKALEFVKIVNSLDEVIADIKLKENIAPLMLATAAKEYNHENKITYNDQEFVWSQKKPVLFILGTARGLSPKLISKADYLLESLEGFADFNHLSVRSAAAVIFDRWLGINSVKQRELKI